MRDPTEPHQGPEYASPARIPIVIEPGGISRSCASTCNKNPRKSVSRTDKFIYNVKDLHCTKLTDNMTQTINKKILA